MALALYRKYRPATFAEVVGQEHVTEPLRTALSAGRINHAYLFSGPRGCGKTSSARILARSLNCVNGPTPDPCGTCNSCLALAPEGGGSVDVIELDAASHGGVDDTRELRDKAFYAPADSRYRIFIIDEAHMVTTQGFNALLKIVEEPPEHLIFVFATTEPDKVLTTIRSRTHHYPFRLIPPSTLQSLLEGICADEGVTVSPMVYPLVIRAGGGSARDTLSVLDQLLAGAGPEGVTYERAVALLGVTDVALIDDMVDALAAGDGGTVFGTVDQLVEAGHDPRRFASDLLDRLRDLVLLQAVPDAAHRGLVAAPGDQLTRMVSQAERLGPAALTRYAEIVHTGLTDMRGATAPRLLLELLCARMMLPSASDTEAAVLQRLEGVERRMTLAQGSSAPEPAARPGFTRPSQQTAAPSTGPAAGRPERSGGTPAPQPATEPPRAAPEPPVAAAPERPAASQPQRPAPQPNRPAAQAERPAAAEQQAEPPAAAPAAESNGPGGIDAATVRRVWPELLKAVAGLNRPTQALLLNATVQAVEGNTLVLAMPTAPLAKQLAQERRLDVLRRALADVLSGQWDVRCVHGQAGAGASAPAPAASAAPSRPAPQRRSEQAVQPERPEPQRPAAQQRPEPQRPEPQRAEPPRAAAPERRPDATDGPPPRRLHAVPEPPPDDEVPLPPEPTDEESIVPESDGPEPRRSADEHVIRLLTQQLGARPVDGR